MANVQDSSSGYSSAFPSAPITIKGRSLSHHLHLHISEADLQAGRVVAAHRPQPIRQYDQIPMMTKDLVRQVKLAGPILSGQRVVFMGDMDGTAALLGLFAANGGPAPSHLTVVDFDERVLEMSLRVAQRYGFAQYLTVETYNVFDPVPPSLAGQSDWFYTNPPYGQHNNGLSVQLFLGRACEMVDPICGSGILIIPDDLSRPWTRQVMRSTQSFLLHHGWQVHEQIADLHRYHLDDDPQLVSSAVFLGRSLPQDGLSFPPFPYTDRMVDMASIGHFYGRTVKPPYPNRIDSLGRAFYRKELPLIH